MILMLKVTIDNRASRYSIDVITADRPVYTVLMCRQRLLPDHWLPPTRDTNKQHSLDPTNACLYYRLVM